MAYSKDWKELVIKRLDRHDEKLDRLLENVAGMKVKIGVGSGVIAIIVSLAIKFM